MRAAAARLLALAMPVAVSALVGMAFLLAQDAALEAAAAMHALLDPRLVVAGLACEKTDVVPGILAAAPGMAAASGGSIVARL